MGPPDEPLQRRKKRFIVRRFNSLSQSRLARNHLPEIMTDNLIPKNCCLVLSVLCCPVWLQLNGHMNKYKKEIGSRTVNNAIHRSNIGCQIISKLCFSFIFFMFLKVKTRQLPMDHNTNPSRVNRHFFLSFLLLVALLLVIGGQIDSIKDFYDLDHRYFSMAQRLVF